MIVTTTNSIEGREISRYNDPIAANVVIGTNIFSDIGASYVDFFGGRSTSYEKMHEMYKRVTEMLKQRAQAIRADAIIGLSVDIDEISGKGSQMFMITPVGTPVHLKEVARVPMEKQDDLLDGELIQQKVRAEIILENYKSLESINKDTVEFIATSGLREFEPLVFKAMNEDYGIEQTPKEKQEMLFRYFDYLPDEGAIAILYNALLEGNLTTLQVKRINAIITSSNFIDYTKAINLLNSNAHARRIALKIFSLDKDWYSKEDIAILKSLEGNALAKFFPELVQVEESKGMFSSGKEVWRCECGHTNKLDYSNCGSCTRDKRGFTEKSLKPEEVQMTLNRRIKIIDKTVTN
ncbi:YbjQ family protein [Sphingobacterium sp. UBA5996]|uniref:YbjQ family protein n=1 Tax=Sphingobacterium sp. UBA5996 TaxID=1947505 RepID=UPI0025D9C852|nr:heavy metal-binding domain-containing protein [Sphingobacterium sp. UBA5996]